MATRLKKFMRQRGIFLILILGFLGVFLFAGSAMAWGFPDAKEAAISVVGTLVGWILKLIGLLLVWSIDMLLFIAQYNGFITSTAVGKGWIVVRDICNMFFVVILLIISIGTILNIKSYHYKQLLPRLLLMAILINFSKMFCGLLIDFAQVIMMTFVNGFAAAGAGNFVSALQIDKLTQVDGNQLGKEGDNMGTIISTMLLALLMGALALITVVLMIIVLTFRIIMLWALIVLSPIAFFFSASPVGKKYSGEWWGEFSKYVIIGPVMAFFLWLSLASLGTGRVSSELAGAVKTEKEGNIVHTEVFGKIGSFENMVSYVIGVSMLIAGLIITRRMGVIAGGMGMNLVEKGAAYAKRGAVWAAKSSTIGVAKKAGSYAGERIYENTGVELRWSKRRALAKERKESVSSQREARGMAKSAQRFSGKRSLLYAMADPRLKSKMSTEEMLLAAVGNEKAKKKLERGREGLAGGAVKKMRAEDAYDGWMMEQKMNKRISIKQENREQKRKEKIEGRQSNKKQKIETRINNNNSQISNYNRQIADIDEHSKRLDKVVEKAERGDLSVDNKKELASMVENYSERLADKMRRTGKSENEAVQDIVREEISKDVQTKQKLEGKRDNLAVKVENDRRKMAEVSKVDGYKQEMKEKMDRRGERMKEIKNYKDEQGKIDKVIEQHQLTIKMADQEAAKITIDPGISEDERKNKLDIIKSKKEDAEKAMKVEVNKKESIQNNIEATQKVVNNIDNEIEVITKQIEKDPAVKAQERINKYRKIRQEAEENLAKEYEDQLEEAKKEAKKEALGAVINKFSKLEQDNPGQAEAIRKAFNDSVDANGWDTGELNKQYKKLEAQYKKQQ